MQDKKLKFSILILHEEISFIFNLQVYLLVFDLVCFVFYILFKNNTCESGDFYIPYIRGDDALFT